MVCVLWGIGSFNDLFAHGEISLIEGRDVAGANDHGYGVDRRVNVRW